MFIMNSSDRLVAPSLSFPTHVSVGCLAIRQMFMGEYSQPINYPISASVEGFPVVIPERAEMSNFGCFCDGLTSVVILLYKGRER